MVQLLASDTISETAITEIVRRIVELFDPLRVIVFGSFARGKAGPDSDLDLLVVMPVGGSRRKKAIEIDRALIGFGVPIDVLVVTPAELERDADRIGSALRPALHEGRVLYERAA